MYVSSVASDETVHPLRLIRGYTFYHDILQDAKDIVGDSVSLSYYAQSDLRSDSNLSLSVYTGTTLSRNASHKGSG